MRKILLFLSLISCGSIWGQTDSIKVFQGFSGGMMLHTGYLSGKDINAPLSAGGVLCSPQGITSGIGGAIRVHLWNHLRVGSEGFISTMKSSATDCRQYLQPGSYVRTGWGGILADACWRGEKIWRYAGGTIGGGAMRSLFLLEGDQNDWAEESRVLLRKQSFFYIDPYVGMDWCLTSKMNVTIRLDWMLAIHHKAIVLPTGPRMYVGFMFCH